MDEKKTLREYLSEATNYLSPSTSTEYQEMERKKFIEFCESHGLSEKFLELIEKDPKWCDLANHQPVYYFVDVPKHLSKEYKKRLPEIKLLACELGTVPVIKILNSKNI